MAALLLEPEERVAAAVAAPVPCLKPVGGCNHGGVAPEALSRLSNFILAAAADDETEVLLARNGQ